MEFDKVKKEHILQGIKDYNEKGLPKGFGSSSTYDVVFEGEKYPPKAIMVYANFYASGRKIEPYFEGGEGKDSFKALELNGFVIVRKKVNENLYKLKQEFLDYWSLDKLQNMTIEEYTDTKRENSFCYWLEHITKELGSIVGGSSYKFGVYEMGDTSKTVPATNRANDGVYAWHTKYGATAVEAFVTIKNLIIKIVNLAQEDALNPIGDIDLGDAFTWKIAFLYNNFGVINIFKKEALNYIANTLYSDDQKPEKYGELNSFILSKKDNQDYFDFTRGLWKHYDTYNSKAEEFQKWLKKYEDEGSNKSSSYLRAIKILITVFSIEVYTEKDTEVLHDLYEDLLINQRDPKGKYAYHKKSYGEKGFYSAAIKKYIQFLKNETNFTISEPENQYQINKKEKSMATKSLNQLFFGPPGTGKTYGTIAEAIKIVDLDFFRENENNREALTKRYQELLITDWKEASGQIAFCTFHQSFTYEDFVEGIKPKTTQNKDIYYDIEPGIFKRICDLADSSKSITKVKTEGVINWSEDAFRKAFFYKLSLGEANNPDDKEIYEFCRDNGYVSIGFAGAHDLSGKSESQIKELCETINEKISAGSQLSTFIHGVSVGDYVLISKGNYFVRALGKVVGDYEYHDDFPIAYNHFRKVEWVFTDENIPIEEMYHTTLMQRSIYRIDHEKLKQDFFVQDNTQMVFSEEKIKPYVLVIDEINRGNVASIFGELITLIEPDKRAGADEELQVMLPYSKEKFSVPDNVYIIGTMNTADRSIEALDSALRRRFSFTEVKPNPSIIDEVLKEKAVWSSIGLSEILETINKRITVLIDRDHQIGHSYFLKLKTVDELDFSQALKAIFSENIIPLLQEYFFNDYVKIGMVLGSGFIKIANTSDNLFAEIEDSLEDDYSDAKEYEFIDLEILDDNQFKSILKLLLNK